MTDLDVLRGGPLFCCLCQRTLKGAFLDASFPDGRSLFCDRLTWFNCAGCGSRDGHRVCDDCVEKHCLEKVPDEAHAAANRPQWAWKVCPEALAVARKLMGDDEAPEKMTIDGQSYNILDARETTIVLDDQVRPRRLR